MKSIQHLNTAALTVLKCGVATLPFLLTTALNTPSELVHAYEVLSIQDYANGPTPKRGDTAPGTTIDGAVPLHDQGSLECFQGRTLARPPKVSNKPSASSQSGESRYRSKCRDDEGLNALMSAPDGVGKAKLSDGERSLSLAQSYADHLASKAIPSIEIPNQ